MCGIAGWAGPNAAASPVRSDLAAMLRALKHRGPDDSGSWFDASHQVALGHNRLSIIDVSPAGHQPMVNSGNGDVLTFNGEIYNYLEVRKTLERAGAKFTSNSDTEVLLLALQHWGLDCLPRLEGMYAFGWWRSESRTLVLARDPFGIKPLYYFRRDNGDLLFASEIKAFHALSEFIPRIDGLALSHFLEFGYCFDDEKTCMEGVRKLPPGHFLSFSPADKSLTVSKYYQSPEMTIGRDISQRRREEALFETLCTVVKQHLNSDVPVALLLSGGLDSSIIAAVASKFTKVQTVSMGFANSEINELPFARIAADWLGTDHHEVWLRAGDVRRSLQEGIKTLDDLFADWGVISTRLLYSRCREAGVKVVLVGEGADELFGGYPVFRQADSKALEEWWLFQLYRRYSGQRYGALYGSFRAKMRKYLRVYGGDRFEAIRAFETNQQLPNNYVMKVDRASMSVGVEARVPFLDRRIAEIALSTPSQDLIAPITEKMLLRQVARRFNLLPPEIVERPKLGASMAMGWMEADPDWRKYSEDLLLSPDGWTAKLGFTGAMRSYFRDGSQGYRFPRRIGIFRNLAWRLLLLELWVQAYNVKPNESTRY